MKTATAKTISHATTKNGRALVVYLYPSAIEGTQIVAVVCSHEINPKTGKPMVRRGRQEIGAYDSHAKAMRAWLYASHK